MPVIPNSSGLGCRFVLPEAVRRIDDRLLGDAGTMAEMQTEVLRRHPNMGCGNGALHCQEQAR